MLMTKLVIQGRNIEITDAIHGHVQQKLGKVMDNFQDIASKINVNLSAPLNVKGPSRQISEVTVYAKGTVIRAEEKHENLYASIDLVADKLGRQLKRYKNRLQRRSERKPDHKTTEIDNVLSEDIAFSGNLIQMRSPKLPENVVRNKFFAMPPMTIQEALDNLQLVDHDFYVFQNAQTGKINVIYERNHGGYGVIQPHKTAT